MGTERFRGALLSTLVIASLMIPLFLITAEAALGQDIEWIRQFGTSAYDETYSIAADPSGNVYVAGRTKGALPGQTHAGEYDAFVRKYDGSGNELWTRQFGSSRYDYAYVAFDSPGNVYVAGSTYACFTASHSLRRTFEPRSRQSLVPI